MAFSQQKSTKSQGKVKKYWLFVDFCWLKAVFSGFTWLSFYRASSSMLTLPSPVKNNLRGAFKILKIHLSTRIMWFRVLNCNVISLAKLSINFKASSTQRRWKGGLCYDSCESSTVRRVHGVILCDQGGQWLRGIEGSMRLLQPSRGRRREGRVHKWDCDCCKMETNTSLENYYRFWDDTYSSENTAT